MQMLVISGEMATVGETQQRGTTGIEGIFDGTSTFDFAKIQH
jgi:hypothetical protein